MKRFVLFTTFVVFLFLPALLPAAITLQKGITIGDWLDQGEAYWVQTTRYSKADFENIQSLGCDHVRMEVNFNASYDDAVPEIFMNLLDKAVMWAEELGLKIVIVNSEDGLTAANVAVTQERLVAMWTEMATHFAAKTDVVALEVYNNPGETITAEVFNGLNAAMVAAIRGISADFTVIVGPTFLYDVDSIDQVQKIDDANVIYAFDMYDPILFTHQNGSYNDVDYLTTSVPFPYDAGSMPEMSAETAGTAAETDYNNYATEGTVDAVKAKIDKAAAFAASNSVTVYCAGFGLDRSIDTASRQLWLETVRSYLDEKNIGWTYSGLRGGFGVMLDGGEDIFKYDTDETTLTALGLTVPEPVSYETIVLEEGFTLFDEEINPYCHIGWWLGDGEPNFFWDENPLSGNVCMAMWYPGQYNAINFYFAQYLDLLALAEAGFVLDMFFRCDDPEGHFQARFEDTNEDFEDHPWRMNYHVDDSILPFDGEWQRVTVPLMDMEDQGAWDPDDSGWYNGGQGLFEWDYVQTFQIVSEVAAQEETELYFDRIRIVDPLTAVKENLIQPEIFSLAQNYPNPFNPSTTIEYSIPMNMHVQLDIYNVRGELVQTLVSAEQPSGSYAASWNGLDMHGSQAASGVYFYRLQAGDSEVSKSMLLMR